MTYKAIFILFNFTILLYFISCIFLTVSAHFTMALILFCIIFHIFDTYFVYFLTHNFWDLIIAVKLSILFFNSLFVIYNC